MLVESDWLDFNSVNIEKLIEEDNIVFVDITADWCATCQFNKINVLNSKIISRKAFDQNLMLLRLKVIGLNLIKTLKNF